MKTRIAIGVALMTLAAPAYAKDKDPVTVTTAKSFKGAQSVVIGSFNIGFLISKTDAAFAGSRGYGGSSLARTTLAGVGAPDFQAITDAAYADFTAKLAAAGYTVIDRTRLTGDPTMAKVKYAASGNEATIVFGKDSKAKAQFFGPTAFGPTPITEGENGNGMFSAFGAMGPAMARNTFAINNKQPILNVSYIVDYASVHHYGGYFALSSSVKLTAQLAIADEVSKLTMISDKGMMGTLALKDPIAVGGEFGELKDSTTGGQKLDNALGNVIGMIGGIGTSSRKFFTFTAMPEQYRLGSIEAAKRANDTMVTRLQALR